MKKACVINPKLKMDILLTQATYPYNYALLDYIPQNIGIDIYSGSGANNTYKSRFGEYYLTPQAEEIVARGYVTGGLASMGPGLSWQDIMFPTFMSQLVKLRISESKDRGLNRVAFWMASIFNQELNLEATAEFAWNINGRTSKEFIVAWAEREGINSPDKVAEVIKKLEYPIRAIAGGIRTRSMVRSIKRMVSLLNGKKPHWGSFFEIRKGFEYTNHEELARALKTCDQAVKISKKLKNNELITGSLLLQKWLVILERYALFMESKDAVKKAKLKQEIKRSVAALPKLHKNWLKSKHLPSKVTKLADKGFAKVMKEFKQLK